MTTADTLTVEPRVGSVVSDRDGFHWYRTAQGIKPWSFNDSLFYDWDELQRRGPLTVLRPIVTPFVEQSDTHEANCQACSWWVHHDRRAGDLDNPTDSAAAHHAATGHPVTVTRRVLIVTEYADREGEAAA